MTGLSNKREINLSAETGNKKSLKFSNAEIEKLSPTFGKVEIPQEAFIGVLKINKETQMERWPSG